MKKKIPPKQYRRYIVMLDCFAHDINGNPIAHHSVYGTDDISAPDESRLRSEDFGGPLLFRTLKRPQVGYGDRDGWAGTALQKAGALSRDQYVMQRIGDRGNGTMFLIYTSPDAVQKAVAKAVQQNSSK
jgi:hypothetical protein